MIRLTRLNSHALTINSDLIKFIENAPDTVLTLVSGEKIVVLETTREVITRIIEYRRQLNLPATVVVPSVDSASEPAMPDLSREFSEDDE